MKRKKNIKEKERYKIIFGEKEKKKEFSLKEILFCCRTKHYHTFIYVYCHQSPQVLTLYQENLARTFHVSIVNIGDRLKTIYFGVIKNQLF